MTIHITASVDVALKQERHYTIAIQSGLLTQVHRLMEEHLRGVKKVFIITDEVVNELYATSVKPILQAAGYEVYVHAIPIGEESKTLAMAEKIYAEALLMNLSRTDAIIALGGGVVGDLAGFCAATFYRGVNFVQIPTTLLAQVDSSVGGKVAVNFSNAKNGIGVFYQPSFVLIDPDVLKSLPERQLKAGLAEVLKYSMIEENCTGDLKLFEYLQTNLAKLDRHWPELIAHCCRIKKAVVVQDETDSKGIRAYLNLGHTFAHAYEAATGYSRILHGEGVAYGLLKAAAVSEGMKIFSKVETDKMRRVFDALGLPSEPPRDLDPKRLLELMRLDKKAEGGKIKFILPMVHIGQVTIRDNVPEELVLSVL